MKRLLLLAVLIASPVYAADKALILTDPEQSAFRAALDAAIRANGLSTISRNAFILSDKLDAAGVVTEKKVEPPPKVDPVPEEQP